jgi:glucose/arabinose dehydrogenase
MALHPNTGVLWLHEHGPRGGDEINLPVRGGNHGWPLATHGVEYSGAPVPEAVAAELPGTEPPLHWWPESPAVSGMAFHHGGVLLVEVGLGQGPARARGSGRAALRAHGRGRGQAIAAGANE